MDEKRASVRWKVALPVRYVGLNKHTESLANTKDISISGARLAMVEKHKPGDRLEMVLDFPRITNRPFCVDADVVWQQASSDSNEECNYLTGVVFRRISECNKKDIAEYIYANHNQEFKNRVWEGIE